MRVILQCLAYHPCRSALRPSFATGAYAQAPTFHTTDCRHDAIFHQQPTTVVPRGVQAGLFVICIIPKSSRDGLLQKVKSSSGRPPTYEPTSLTASPGADHHQALHTNLLAGLLRTASWRKVAAFVSRTPFLFIPVESKITNVT